uniref:Capsid and scaffold protein n=1 Tax=Salmonella phage vB_SE130_2P TaxID=3236707 RepID=A0AB39C3Z1_9VIRU
MSNYNKLRTDVTSLRTAVTNLLTAKNAGTVS